MKNFIALFVVLVLGAGGFYCFHKYNSRMELEAKIELARLEQEKARLRLLEEEKRREEERRRAEAAAKEEKRREEEQRRAEAAAKEEKRREEEQRKADEKLFQINLKSARKSMFMIRCRTYNTPVKELVKFQQCIERLSPPEEILTLAKDLPVIAMAIKMPSSRRNSKNLPRECFRKPPCSSCHGSGKKIGRDLESRACSACEGTGVQQKTEKRAAISSRSVEVYSVHVDAEEVFDLPNAIQAFRNRVSQLSAWLDMQ